MHNNIVGDAFWSHNQNKGHVFEDDENKATRPPVGKPNHFKKTFLDLIL